MSIINKIKDLNELLIRTDTRCDIIEYIKKVNELSSKPIDLSFMEELLAYVEVDECCIPHTLLVKYKVLSNTNVSANVKILMEQYEFIEGEDFRLLNVQESAPKGGCTHKINYTLHPKTFKYCLMRAKNTRLYSKYYILLEECVKYYHMYQLRYKEYIISQKDDKIDTCLKEIQLLKESNNDQTKQIQELLRYSKDTAAELIRTSDNLECTMSNLSVVQDKLEIAVEDRAVKPYDSNKVNQIAVLRSKENSKMYYITCGQKVNVDRAIRLRSKDYDLVTTIDKIPNSIYLFDHIRKQLDCRVKTSIRNIHLISITEDILLDEIQSLFDGRKNVDLSRRP